jgi:hypothetical protein
VAEPEIDTLYADLAFLETRGNDATKVKAAIWAYTTLTDDGFMSLSLNEVRARLVEAGFQVVPRG